MKRTSPKFTDRDIELIKRCLPAGVNNRRLNLLPRILDEWCRLDVPEHLLSESRAVLSGRVKRLESVSSAATKLLSALQAVDKSDDRLWLTRELATAQGSHRSSLADQSRRLDEQLGLLTELHAAAVASIKNLKGSRGRPRNVTAHLVLRDIAAIFEWLTNRKASRQVSRENGDDTGPFWEFAAALWPVVFGRADDGLSAAIRNWASAQKAMREGKLKRERSPVLANINFRYPKWGIFKR